VTLYANTTPLQVQTDSPLEFNARLTEPGAYVLWLEALDDNGVPTRSRNVSLVVRPTNDNFEDAYSLEGYQSNGVTSNRSATLQAYRRYPWERRMGEPTYADNQGGHSVWWRWIAPADGICTIIADGQGFGVLINACVGTTVSNLSSIANNAMGSPGPVAFQAVRGTVYHISLDGFFGEEGIITWSLVLRPRNDDFTDRAWINGTQYEVIASPAGASLEANEAALSGGSNAVSLWYSWTPPVSAPVMVSAISSDVRTRLVVFRGDSLFQLEPLVESSNSFALNSSVSFAAVEGTPYQIGLFCEDPVTNEVRLILSQQVPRITSPPDGATFAALARVTLSAQFNNSTNSPGEMRYYVNDSLLGSTSAPPYTLAWNDIIAGTYKIRAYWVSQGQTNSTLPVTILVYSNAIMPTPRIFGGVYGTYCYALNAVGALSVLGSPDPQFGITESSLFYYPRLAIGPAAVRRWSIIGAGSRDRFWNVPYSGWGFLSWGLTEDGDLYRNGTERVVPPQGVNRWLDLFASSGTCFAVGDNGKVYLGGTTPIEVTAQAVLWKKVAVMQYYFATLLTFA